MTTLKMIKVEPELCIIDDPYVSNIYLCQISSTQSNIFEQIESTIPASSTVPASAEKRILNVNINSNNRNRCRPYNNGFISYCSDCGKSFDKLIEYEEHMSKMHNIKPYECAKCGRKFSRKSYLTPHMRVHTREKPYSCKICTASFSRSSDFKKHNRSHQGIKMFKCELCDKRFTRAFSLRYHLNGHIGEKNFACEICGAKFRKSTSYYYHKKALCKKTFECVYCKMTFQSGDSIKYHLRTRHWLLQKQLKAFLNKIWKILRKLKMVFQYSVIMITALLVPCLTKRIHWFNKLSNSLLRMVKFTTNPERWWTII